MSELAQTVVLFLGLAFVVIGNIWFIVEGFKANVLWGLGILFLPFISFFFLFAHWKEAKSPFLLEVAGIGMIVLSLFPKPPLGVLG